MGKAAMLSSLEPAVVTQAGKVHDVGNALLSSKLWLKLP